MSAHNVDNLPRQVVVPDLRNGMGEDFTQLLLTTRGMSEVRGAGAAAPCLFDKATSAQKVNLHSMTEPPHWKQRTDQECRK